MAQCPDRDSNDAFGRIMRLATVLVAGLTTLFAAQNVQAGFEWKPPQNQSTGAQNQGTQSGMPAYRDQRVRRQPQSRSSQRRQQGRGTGRQQPQRQRGSMPTNITGQPRGREPGQDIISRDRLRPDMPREQAVPGQETSRQQNSRDVRAVEGFGNEIPLALALRQIVPDDYTYSFDEGVNHKTSISWESGENWQTTLRRALHPEGLDMQIQNNVVHIKKASRRMARQGRTSSQTKMQRGRLTRPGRSQSAQKQGPDQRRQASANAGMQHYNTVNQRRPQSSQSMAPVSVPTGMRGTRNAWEQVAAGHAGMNTQRQSRNTDTMQQQSDQTEALSKTYSFEADDGDSLRSTLQRWSQKAGVELRWDLAYDFTLREDVEMQGDFAKAVSQLLAQYSDAAPKPHGRLHTTSDSGNPVLIIE